MKTDSCLSLCGVRKRYGDFELDVSFELPAGCIMGFIGENGAGKTTTFKLILDLIRREAGEILFLGRDIRESGRLAREEIGVVFDECSFYESLSTYDIGRVLAGIHPRWDQQLFEGYLTRWGIPRKKPVKSFSRGMKMKLSIAAALSHHPRLLLLDEATSGLDPIMRSEVLDTLQEFVQDEEHAVLLSSHITSDLDRIADYVTFLHAGKAILSENKDTLLFTYGILKGSEQQLARLPGELVLGRRWGAYGCEALVCDISRAQRLCPEAAADRPNLEEIMILLSGGQE
ncbi:MAG: ABC transporter ATP-binding protein [Provencibacterium sp.]|jgi:ABC-2 type transport system ATP-binding protein|nr:ABC transporter ATP-binding protein [Provencibacterium sp.]